MAATVATIVGVFKLDTAQARRELTQDLTAAARRAGSTAGSNFSGGFRENVRTLSSSLNYGGARAAAARAGGEAGGSFASRFREQLRDLGPAIGVGAAVEGFKKIIESGAELSDTISAVGVVFKDAQDQVLSFSDTTAKSLGISKQQALTASQTFGIFGKQAGLAG